MERFFRGLHGQVAYAVALIALFTSLPGALFGARTAAAPPVLDSPAPGGTLPGSTVTFAWTAGTDVSEYVLHVNTAPGDPMDPSQTRIFNSGSITRTSVTASNLPTSGAAIYIILGARYGGSWHYVTYAYLEASAIAGLSGISCTTSSLAGPATDNCTLTLSGGAPAGGMSVNLASNNSAVTVPPSVQIASGATSAGFTATAAAVSTAQTATLTASTSNCSRTFTLSLSAYASKLGVSTSSLSFGSDPVNTAITQTVTLTSTGNAPLTVSAAAISGVGFTVSGATFPLALNQNQTAVLTVQFDPAAAGAATGALSLTSNSSTGSSTSISLSGTGVPVPTGLTCTNASMTGTGTDSCTVSLNTAAATGGFAVSLSSSNSAVRVPASVTVASGAISAGFSATISSVSAAVTVTLTASANSASQTFAILLGSGTPTLSTNATTIAFGNVSLNSPATQSLTLVSTGTAPVTVNAAAASGSGFSVSGASFPLTLNPNQTAILSIEFDPTVTGAVTGSLSISSNSPTNPTDVITLTGIGVSTSYQVNLAWSAPINSSDPVAGYNVYRAPGGSTSYQQMNSSIIAQTTYIDPTVTAGQAYSYIVESVDASGTTSRPSNMSSVDVP